MPIAHPAAIKIKPMREAKCSLIGEVALDVADDALAADAALDVADDALVGEAACFVLLGFLLAIGGFHSLFLCVLHKASTA